MNSYKQIKELYHSALNESNSLSHFGIKGMKWGVQRYLDENNKLTDEGKQKKRELKGARKKGYKEAIKLAKRIQKSNSRLDKKQNTDNQKKYGKILIERARNEEMLKNLSDIIDNDKSLLEYGEIYTGNLLFGGAISGAIYGGLSGLEGYKYVRDYAKTYQDPNKPKPIK